MALTKRVEVLFDPQKHAYLEQLARRGNTTIGELVREAVEKAYLSPDLDRRLEAAAWLTAQNIDFGGDWEHIKGEAAHRLYQDILKSLGDSREGYEVDRR